MLNINKKQATSPASKKPSQEGGKVGRGTIEQLGAGKTGSSTPCGPLFAHPQGGSEKPKRPVSAMFIFSEEKRRQLQEERPELSESELTRLLARMWNDLSEKKKVRPARPEGLPGRLSVGCCFPRGWLHFLTPALCEPHMCLGSDGGAGSPAGRKAGSCQLRAVGSLGSIAVGWG